MWSNQLTEALGIKYPIVQAPMAGGITTTELVAAVSNEGALGMIGAGYMTSSALSKQVKEVKEKTKNPFGVNLFVPVPYAASEDELEAAYQVLKPYRKKLGLSDEEVEIPDYDRDVKTFQDFIEVIVEEKVPICSFTFSLPDQKVIKRLKDAGVVLIGTATTVEEAMAVEKSGMDMVVVQGSEAGGHRGHFLKKNEESMIGLLSLIPQTVNHVDIPVIAAGGIADGRGAMAVHVLGGAAIQIGTAFLTCRESGANPAQKEAILRSSEEQIVMTRAFSGKWARGIQNQFIHEMSDFQFNVPSFPIQNALTKDIRSAASQQVNTEYMSLWSGQSPRMAKEQTVRELIHSIAEHEHFTCTHKR
ncbi:NAD(P)H-dependent flavin oxidoreductase [Jeotgalibacillus campisalis]|uniref:Probable nitronate monooxygenase n=1 Tax=Jeotgalibacillus campisalis TaxID=220754 RepID=A0A0C2W2N8_9BACL|nr:nitronate monooxygenase [Jeotgalibacillus campisalis]KIL50891.1 nitronate monooxygenase [Jeotgalibacillus campisalis]